MTSRELQAIVGVSSGTIVKWTQAGMPCTGGRGTGKRTAFELDLVAEWIEAEGRPKRKYLEHIRKHDAAPVEPATVEAKAAASKIAHLIEEADTPDDLARLMREIMVMTVDPKSKLDGATAELLRRQIDTQRQVLKLREQVAAKSKVDPLQLGTVPMDKQEYDEFLEWRRARVPRPLKPGESVDPPAAPKG